MTGNQAVQQVRAGLQAIYLSGWQVAADANLAGQTYPDQSLYPVNSVPQVVRRINNALLRADQITWSESADGDVREQPYWLAPIVADAEAGFGGVLNAFELMKSMIAAGAAGVHWEDQLASEKKCGHLGGKVLIPTGQHIRTLNAARLAADVCDVPTLVIARTDAQAATLLTSDVDERDQPFVTGDAHRRGVLPGAGTASSRASRRGLAYAPYSDLLWMETSTPGPRRGPAVRRGHQERLPGPDARLQLLAVVQLARAPGRVPPSRSSARSLPRMGYRFQFITLAGFHALNHSMFDLATRLRRPRACPPTSGCRRQSSRAEKHGYTATRHQREAGTGYFDLVTSAISPNAETIGAGRLHGDRAVPPGGFIAVVSRGRADPAEAIRNHREARRARSGRAAW